MSRGVFVVGAGAGIYTLHLLQLMLLLLPLLLISLLLSLSHRCRVKLRFTKTKRIKGIYETYSKETMKKFAAIIHTRGLVLICVIRNFRHFRLISLIIRKKSFLLVDELATIFVGREMPQPGRLCHY